mmetsp:Transcript_45099/g.125024  ORF Transcript_45099/g.125024 Transcript_45099/m.125024 type:complete len:394 (+) Transcript_45099:55-1236(+)
MASKGMKRPAAADQVRFKRPAAADPASQKCLAIAEALRTSDKLSASAASSLAACVKWSLLVPKDERHAFFETMVNMIEETLGHIEAKSLKAVEEAQARFDGTTKASRQEAVAEAEASLRAADCAIAECRAAVDDARAEVSAAGSKLQSAEAAQEANAAKVEEMFGWKDTVEATVQEALESLKAGVKGAVQAQHYRRVSKVARKLRLERSLIEALRWAVDASDENRGPFDRLTITSFEEACVKQAGQLEQRAEEEKLLAGEFAAAVERAKDQLRAAEEKRGASAAALKEKVAGRSKEVEALKLARAAVANFLGEAKQAADDLDAKKRELVAFREGPLAAFAELKDRKMPAVSVKAFNSPATSPYNSPSKPEDEDSFAEFRRAAQQSLEVPQKIV